jgi:adenylate cyclase
LVEDLEILANQRDVPYRSLLKVFLAERLEQEIPRRRAVGTRLPGILVSQVSESKPGCPALI